ncbi:MAG: hypothetical protein Q8L52_02160 [bacterium]|nr:hypothetical protein [bacterium]
MITAQLNKQIGAIVEQKLLEFLGDPDEGLQLKRSFIINLQKRLKEKHKTVPLSMVMKKYGLH